MKSQMIKSFTEMIEIVKKRKDSDKILPKITDILAWI